MIASSRDTTKAMPVGSERSSSCDDSWLLAGPVHRHTWEEFLAAGGEVSGFRESRWGLVQRMRPGDYLLCYLTGLSRWIAILEVVSNPFRDTTRIWKDEDFPCRVKVRIIAALDPATAVPVIDLRDRLSAFQNLKNPNAWSGYFRSSPIKWSAADGKAVVRAVLDAKAHPITRSVDRAKLARRPRALKSRIGPVTIPEPDIPSAKDHEAERRVPDGKEATARTEIQWRLLKLGSDMGYDVWVARNDRGRAWQRKPIASIPRLRSRLPRQFDEQTNKTIELIDVLWLNGNAVVAAFEIEGTTSIYSGLLRMADLVAMQPNLNIPLYLVAPDERRQKVFTEVSRPTFRSLSPPLEDLPVRLV
jgi:predicted RNA-binding protein